MWIPLLRITSACCFMSTPPMHSSVRSSGAPSVGRGWGEGREAGGRGAEAFRRVVCAAMDGEVGAVRCAVGMAGAGVDVDGNTT
jgi:hypothetical protein